MSVTVKEEKSSLAAITIEMAKPRVAGSARHVCPVIIKKYPTEESKRTLEIITAFNGIYARVARTLKVDPSLVSRVASGRRTSPAISSALWDELKELKKKLASHYD